MERAWAARAASPIQEHQPRRKQGREGDLGLRGHGTEKGGGSFDEQAAAVAGFAVGAMAPRWVSRFSELMAVCNTQWLA